MIKTHFYLKKFAQILRFDIVAYVMNMRYLLILCQESGYHIKCEKNPGKNLDHLATLPTIPCFKEIIIVIPFHVRAFRSYQMCCFCSSEERFNPLNDFGSGKWNCSSSGGQFKGCRFS